jgi:hypothetical protein
LSTPAISLVGGSTQNSLYEWFALRYNSDGSVDNSFGNSGALHSHWQQH